MMLIRPICMPSLNRILFHENREASVSKMRKFFRFVQKKREKVFVFV